MINMADKDKELYEFKKNKATDKIWWTTYVECFGESFFTFDKIKLYSLWNDYPDKLTDEEKEIFDNENPFWRRFFSKTEKAYDEDGLNIPEFLLKKSEDEK